MMRAIALFLTVASFASAEEIDLVKHPERWLSHPVLGGPCVGAWEPRAGNPIITGELPYEWPVNGTLFIDPVGGNWYCYVGRYLRNYAMNNDTPMHCIVLRSKDAGATWENLGRVIPPDPPMTYAGETSPLAHAPDVQVIYADGKYHACFDWCSASTTWENAAAPGLDSNSGVGYAWAEHPEGPWHVTERPIATTRDMPLLNGKYRRLYASSIVRRKNDWLLLSDVDSGPSFGWGVVGMTAEHPEGPYSAPKLLLSCEGDLYHPPLLEFFPCHVDPQGRLNLHATSVAKNRGVQADFTVDLEKAMEPSAWRLQRMDTLLKPSTMEYENAGIWGQAYSLAYNAQGIAALMYPSRNARGMGTINLAQPALQRAMAEKLYVAGSYGAALALAPVAGKLSSLKVTLHVTGNVTLFWGHTAPLGPDAPRSDAAPAPISRSGYCGINFCDCGEWKLIEVPVNGVEKVLKSDSLPDAPVTELQVDFADGKAVLSLNDNRVYDGALSAPMGNVGLLPDPHSFAELSKLEMQTAASDDSARTSWLASEALLGAAQSTAPERWQQAKELPFRYGEGWVSRAPDVRAKWNITGDRVALWSPRGPGLGSAEIVIDGVPVAMIDLHAETPKASKVVYTSETLKPGPHAVVVRPRSGAIALDSLDVYAKPLSS